MALAPQRGINDTNMDLFAEEKSSGFANKKCDDFDLFTVAHKIAGCCEYIEINEIGRGLGLEESTAQEVAEQHGNSPYGDVIHELLLQWKEKAVTSVTTAAKAATAGAEATVTVGEAVTTGAEATATVGEAVTADAEAATTAEDTWANLVPLLHSIFNSEPLMKALSDYFHQKVDPNPENVGAEVQDVCIIHPRHSETDTQAFLEISHPPSDSSQSNYLQGDSKSQQASDDDRTTIRQLVTGKAVTPLSPDSSEGGINLVVKRKMDEEKEKFAALLGIACEKLQDLGVTPGKIGVYLTQLSIQPMESTPLLFDEHTAGMISKTSHSQIFMFLSRVGAWGFLNFNLLGCVAKRYGDGDLQRKVEEYGRGIASFMEETKFKDYLQVCTNRIPYGILPGRKPLIVELEEKWGDFTLDKVAKLQGDLEGQFGLEPYIFNLCNGGPKSVMIMWLIPSSAVSIIKKAIMKKRVDFRGLNICELIVGENRFIFKPEVHTATCVPTSPTVTSLTSSTPPTSPAPQVDSGEDGIQSLLGPGTDYTTAYKESIQNPTKFWGDLGRKSLHWKEPFQKVMDYDMKKREMKWFTGGKLNISENCLDRHVKSNPDAIALIWEKNEPGHHEEYTYRKLLDMTCRVANVLKDKGIGKGDTVAIYMPVHPLAVASMLACARIGAVHSVIFAAVDRKVLKKRLVDANAKAVITVNRAVIGKVVYDLKKKVDEAVPGTTVKVVFVATRVHGVAVNMTPERDVPLEEAMESAEAVCPPEPMDSEDKLFIMYTSGTSEKPKGVIHTQAGYLLYAAATHRAVFNYKEGDVFACVADLGWITGHTYVVYGPLCNGATTVLFESTAAYPNCDRYLEMIQRLQINQFYATPSVLKYLMHMNAGREDDMKRYDLSTLKTLASVGEPLSPATWKWCSKWIGQNKCAVLNTWWQTETGGIAIVLQPPPDLDDQVVAAKSFPAKPFFGVEPVLFLNERGQELQGDSGIGCLCLKQALPGMGRQIHGDTDDRYKGCYFTCDLAQRNKSGGYQVIGRVDDAIRIKGVWLDIPLIESRMEQADPDSILEASIIDHNQQEQDISEAEPKDVKTLVAFVKIKKMEESAKTKIKKMINCVTDVGMWIGSIFFYSETEESNIKTPTGKTMKRRMRKIAGKKGITAKPYQEPVCEELNRMNVEDEPFCGEKL